MSSVKITTLGAATLDVFLTGKDLHAKRDVRTHDYVEQFPLGAKLELDNVIFSTGGGATNAAVTFARQGFDTSVMAKIGDDVAGREVLKELGNDDVNTGKIACDLDGATGYSTILLASNGERTILVYRGASEDLSPMDFKLDSLSSDWLYISSLAGNFNLLESVIKAAVKAKIKIALNPGSKELTDPPRLKKLLDYLSVLIVNRQEMEKLYGQQKPTELIKQASTCCQYVLMTDGANGCWATEGTKVYRAGMYKDVKVIDRSGAGDAFGSGFLAMLADGKDMETAVSFASANSTSVVRYIGAKEGILTKSVKVPLMKIEITDL